jgi:kumamolisin
MANQAMTVTPHSGDVPLSGSDRRPRPGFEPVGAANQDDELRVVIKVRPKQELPDPDDVGALLPSQRGTPASHEQHAADFGARQADIDAVVAFAKDRGLTVEEADAESRLVVVTGSAGAMSRAFGVGLERYEALAGNASYRGRVGPVHVPAALEPVITVVTGLDDRRQVRPLATAEAAAGPSATYTPVQLAEIYGFPNLDGGGQCIGLLEFDGGYQPADISAYFEQLGITEPTVKAVSVGHHHNSPGSEADGEVVLDIDVAGAAAPGAEIAVYFSTFTSAGWVEAITKAIHDKQNKPSVLSISWGWVEFEDAGTLAWTAQVMDEVDTMFKEAANLGVTVIVAAGDDGSEDNITDNKPHVNYPASSPYVLSCGGTTLVASGGQRTSEVVWGFGARSDGSGHGSTGGGVSEHFPLPTWQSDPSIGVPKSAGTGFAGRGMPDVAADADGRTGYWMLIDGQMQPNGGTSAAAPLWAALIARVNQQLAADGSQAVGYFNPLLYTTLGPSGAFHDITSGSNDTHGNLGAYSAKVGWDACTGWGVPNGAALLTALQGK